MKNVFLPYDVVSMLAWLDFCISTKRDFKQTICEHLSRRRRAMGNNNGIITYSQVQNKLGNLARTKHTNAYSSLRSHGQREDLERNGSHVLTKLPEEFHAEIRQEVENYRLNSGLQGENPSLIEATRGDNRSYKNVQSLSSGNPEVLASPNATASNFPTEDISSRPPTNSQEYGSQGHVSPSEPQISQPLVRGAESSTQSTEVERIRKRMEDNIREKEENEERLLEKVRVLETQIHHMIMAQAERERDSKNPLEREFYRYTHDLWRQYERNKKLSDLIRLFDVPSEESSFGFDHSTIDEAMSSIEFELSSILHMHKYNTGGRLLTPELPPTSDLIALISSPTNNATVSSGTSLLRKYVLEYQPEHIIKTLALVAIRDWVFHTDFPSFVPEGGNLLLEAYRELAFHSTDGLEVLRRYELAAYRHATSRELFRNMLLRRASHLVARFTKALAPLFVSPSSAHEVDVDDWGQAERPSKRRTDSLLTLFETALKFKVATVGTGNLYEFVIHPVGATCDQSMRIIPTPSQSLARASSGPEYWLHATISMYQTDQRASFAHDTLADAIVKPSNFLTQSENRRVPQVQLLHKQIIKSEKVDGLQWRPLQPLSQICQEAPQGSYPPSPTTIINPTTSNIETNAAELLCDQCGTRFSGMGREANFRRHKRNQVCRPCQSCKRMFSGQQAMRKHQASEHSSRRDVREESGRHSKRRTFHPPNLQADRLHTGEADHLYSQVPSHIEYGLRYRATTVDALPSRHDSLYTVANTSG